MKTQTLSVVLSQLLMCDAGTAFMNKNCNDEELFCIFKIIKILEFAIAAPLHHYFGKNISC